MKTLGWLAALLLVTGCINLSLHTNDSSRKRPSAKETPPPNLQSVVTDSTLAPSIDAFGIDLYRKLAAKPGNLVFSPLSVSTVLASLAPGAAGRTREEMLRVLHLGTGRVNFLALTTGLDLRTRSGGAAWNLANRTWLQSGLPISQDYVGRLRDDFGDEIGETDFARAPDSSRVAINRWVASQTQNRIQDLFEKGSIDPSMRLVLVNAIYFKGRWQHPFDKDRTRPETFHGAGQQTFPVPMMERTQEFPFARIGSARVLELPYEGDQLSMVILLPDQADQLSTWEARLTPDSLRAWTSHLVRHEVDLKFPKFTLRWKSNLNRTLADLGMPTAFEEGVADFSGIVPGRGLYLGIVIHAAFIDVNEEGTEAAAATGAGLRATAVQIPEPFVVNRPFLYLIRDRATGCILFMGRVTDPRG